ncbi:DNA/RNA non-specific endonuclease [Limosilactobacillus secaliphilus]|uniref:DNA/RNA non-specific endonuclease n=1 Tax=Limosilactobacillus secaliphilus TaxID=396268 RepID=UPI00070F3D87|nr:DNA/RNA non-specific endonuclease [Limosilactobacillus secaliphilus]
MKRKIRKLWHWLAVAAILFAVATAFQRPADGSKYGQTPSISARLHRAWGSRSYQTAGNHGLPTPTQSQAQVTLTPAVRQQLPSKIEWNNHGAYILNDNHPQLNADINSAPYAVNHVDDHGRAWRGDAWLNKTTRQYRNRQSTGNGANDWKPAGFLQASHLKGRPTHAYDRGHLLGYALVGGLHGFDVSESNPKNIATQTAWANEARSSQSTGQNYYEGLVRKALDQGKQVRYRVTDIYDGDCLVPAGAHIEALSKDGSVSFNVFVPNVQANIKINYANGAVKQR